MFTATYTQLKLVALAVMLAKPMPVRWALDEAYAQLFAAHEEAERDVEVEAEARLEASQSRFVNRWY